MSVRYVISTLVLSTWVITAGCGGDDSPTLPTPVCSYSIAPAASSFGADGGSGSFNVTAAAACSWMTTTNAPWIAITGGASGNGSGSVAYSVALNTAAETRTATVIVGDQTHTVSQGGASPVACSYDISPTQADVPMEETRGTFAVTAPAGCSWTATSDAPWLVVSGGSPGSGSGSVSFMASANTAVEGRQGRITLGEKVFTVRQNGSPALCQYSVAPLSFNPCMAASSVVATVSAPTACGWTTTLDVPWLSLSSGSSGNGNGTITILFSDNYDAPREGTVMVRWPTPTAGQNIHIAQAGCQYGVSQSSFTFSSSGGTATLNVFQQAVPNTCGGATQDRCRWSAVSDVSWITIPGSNPRIGDDQVVFAVGVNATGSARIGRITIRDRVVVITQAQ